jgi:hypothetical protein
VRCDFATVVELPEEMPDVQTSAQPELLDAHQVRALAEVIVACCLERRRRRDGGADER